MDKQSQPVNKNEDAWIEKYRAALDSAPIHHSMLEQLRRLLEDARALLAVKGAKVLERYSSSALKAHRLPPMPVTTMSRSPEAKQVAMSRPASARLQKD